MNAARSELACHCSVRLAPCAVQKESEADAKVARLMALDATKDGFVARRVRCCKKGWAPCLGACKHALAGVHAAHPWQSSPHCFGACTSSWGPGTPSATALLQAPALHGETTAGMQSSLSTAASALPLVDLNAVPRLCEGIYVPLWGTRWLCRTEFMVGQDMVADSWEAGSDAFAPEHTFSISAPFAPCAGVAVRNASRVLGGGCAGILGRMRPH